MMPREEILKSKGLSYKILSTLKQSKDISVYKALRQDQSSSLCQKVVLKIFSQNTLRYKEELDSFLSTGSSYCAQLLGFESFGEKTGLVLEYVKGVSLFQLLETFSLEEKEIKNLLTQIYHGLKDLKSFGICHGDLSLHNVLLDQEGKIKFIDFGKANYQTGTFGTLPFVAPEVLKGIKPNFQSDLFSLGVLEVFLKNPSKLYYLKKKKASFFSKETILGHLDPKKRRFLLCKEESAPLPSLKQKIQLILHKVEKREWETEKLHQKTSFSSPFKIQTALINFILFFLIGISATASSEKAYLEGGLLSIRTNKWFLIQGEGFESYAPLEKILPVGTHKIFWKSGETEGVKTFTLSKEEILILTDKDFLKR